MINSREDRLKLWRGIESRATLDRKDYGYNSDTGFQNQCRFLRVLADVVSDPKNPQQAEALDMRDFWIDGVVGSAVFIELNRKIRFEHWHTLCLDFQETNPTFDNFRAKLRRSSRLHRPDVKLRRSHLDASAEPTKVVDYKRLYREAEIRIRNLESEISILQDNLTKVCDLAGGLLADG